MKKRLLLTLSVASVATLALASCGDAKSNLNTDKDFTVTVPEADSDAKLIKHDEIAEYFDSICVNQATADEEENDYKENYNSLAIISQYNNVFTSDTNNGEDCIYNKTVYDYNSNIGWHYEKEVIKYKDDNGKTLTYVNEIETKFVLKDNYYIVKTDFKLDKFKIINPNPLVNDSWEDIIYDQCKYISGTAKLYTKVDVNDCTKHLDYSKSMVSSFTEIVKDGSVANSIKNEASEIYAKEDYLYGVQSHSNEEGDEYKQILLKKPLFRGVYYIRETKEEKREQFVEMYLSKDSILDDSMSLEGYTEYEMEQKLEYDNPLPYFSTLHPLISNLGLKDSNHIFEKYFTVE